MQKQLATRGGRPVSASPRIGDLRVELAVDKAIERITRAIAEQRCVLFLGAGIHAAPPEESVFEYPEEQRPPSGGMPSSLKACSIAWRDWRRSTSTSWTG